MNKQYVRDVWWTAQTSYDINKSTERVILRLVSCDRTGDDFNGLMLVVCRQQFLN
jgi:hypothetical protein